MTVATAPVATDVDRLTAKLGAREPGHLIDGAWTPSQSGETFPVYNPATGGVIANVALGDKADIDRAVQARPARARRPVVADGRTPSARGCCSGSPTWSRRGRTSSR